MLAPCFLDVSVQAVFLTVNISGASAFIFVGRPEDGFFGWGCRGRLGNGLIGLLGLWVDGGRVAFMWLLPPAASENRSRDVEG